MQNTVELSFRKKQIINPTIEQIRIFATSPSVKTLCEIIKNQRAKKHETEWTTKEFLN